MENGFFPEAGMRIKPNGWIGILPGVSALISLYCIFRLPWTLTGMMTASIGSAGSFTRSVLKTS